MQRRWLSRLIVLLIVVGVAATAEDFPLPAEGYAATIDVSAGWRFAWDGADHGVDQGWAAPDFDRRGWTSIDLPRVWDREPGTLAMPIRNGVGWYARHVRVPEDWTGPVRLHFLGAMYQTDVWVDGTWVDLNLGGYTPFAIELEGIAPGAESLVVVRVDNRLSHETVPGPKHGWQSYGGITREVWLCQRPPVHFEGLAWQAAVATDGAVVLQLDGRIVNASAAAAEGWVKAQLAADGAVVGTATAALAVAAGAAAAQQLELRLPAPRLWSPEDPFLHRLVLSWPGGGLTIPLGLRELRIEGERLLLNNRPLWLQGFGIHEEWPGHGPCVPRAERAAELAMLKREYAINSLRPGHYPNHPELYRICDELGILVFTEIPAWQIPGGFLGSELGWEDWLQPQLDAMVDSYRAFTCVASWGGGNESKGEAADGYHRRAQAYLAQRDPSRIPIVVLDSTYELRAYRHAVMGARNYHFGWYHSPAVYGLRQGHAENLEAAAGRPIWIAEQGAHAIRGRYNGAYNDSSRGSEIYQDHVARFGFQYAATRNDAIIGISPWSWADFHRDNRIEPHGVVDHERQPKLVAATLRNLMGGGPHRIFGCEFTTHCQPGGKLQVELHAFRPEPERVSGAHRYHWSIRNAQGVHASGEGGFSPDGARSQLLERVEWSIPAEASGCYSLWMTLEDAAGHWLHSNAVHFGVGPAERPGVLIIPPQGADACLVWDGLRIPIHQHPGLMIPLDPGDYAFELQRGTAVLPIEASLRSDQATTIHPAWPADP